MFWGFIALFFVAQIESPPGSPPHTIEAETPLGRWGLGIDGELDTKGTKDVRLGYIYSIPLSERLQSELDLIPFVVQRVDTNTPESFHPDPNQGGGVMIRYRPGNREEASAWYFRVKVLSEPNTDSGLSNNERRENWELSAGIDLPLDRMAKDKRKLKKIHQLHLKESVTMDVPMKLFHQNFLSVTERQSLHTLIILNYLLRLSEYLSSDIKYRSQLEISTSLVDAKKFPDPLKLIMIIERKAYAQELQTSSDINDDLKRRLFRILRDYQLILRAATAAEQKFLKIIPTGIPENIRADFVNNELYLDADQMIDDCLKVWNIKQNQTSILGRF